VEIGFLQSFNHRKLEADGNFFHVFILYFQSSVSFKQTTLSAGASKALMEIEIDVAFDRILRILFTSITRKPFSEKFWPILDTQNLYKLSLSSEEVTRLDTTLYFLSRIPPIREKTIEKV